MTLSFNRVELIGRLGHDPEMRFLSDGQAMTRFSLATDRAVKPDVQPETDWHQVVCWRKLAEFAGQYLAKGRLVFIAGRLTYRSWEDKDGQKRRSTEVVATEIILLDRRQGAETEENVDAEEDDLPF